MASPKTTPDKKSDAAGQPSAKRDERKPDNITDRSLVSSEFWDNLLDSIPPWGDEIAAIVLLVFGIVSFLSLLNVSSDATIANAWSNALTTLFGYGSVIVSAGILALGIIILLPKVGLVVKFPTSRILALEIAFFSVLALLHLGMGDSELRAVARAGQGGGYIGWALSILISGLFGSVTAIVFYGLLLVLSLGVVVGIRKDNLQEWIKTGSSRLRRYGDRIVALTNARLQQRQPVITMPVETPAKAAEVTKRTTATIVRVRLNPENLPPSQRPGAGGSGKDDTGENAEIGKRS
ncbi:MAG: hypothetical protein K8I60_18420, partial [Anaerolineae bacterium]|nr:hypothetical protein [Anaerolineae bacterium]